ncbi:DNA repair protein RadA [Desertimonas flava]|uniref:DNA repair protein RadA n=1 Tax=Desertimonas flava TaxID=2064846 RepID=UPI000E354F3E|nr:DNA repair protein RadA [Desertimonas flava]
MSIAERPGRAGRASRTTTVLSCVECGTPHSKWVGQCSTCGAWNSLVEETVEPSAPAARVQPAIAPLTRLDAVDAASAAAQPTGIDELDRVLGSSGDPQAQRRGGLVAGSVTLLGGEPGIGKSTLVLQLAAGWPGPVLYVSGEESPQQVKARAERLGHGAAEHLWIAAETSMRGIIAALDEVQPTLAVIDSIQTIADERIASSPGSPNQVRECAQQLVSEAKRRGVAVILVGHVTKEGSLAGPRALEHVVDTVLSFEGERHHALRLMRAVKHRFGSTNELGLFEMTGEGLEGVPDPSHLFLSDGAKGVSGSVVVPAMEGQRPLLVEIQALTVSIPPNAFGRRHAQGLDNSRLAMLLAVIDKRLHMPSTNLDVYASTVGGAKVDEPGTDLGVALAVVGAIADQSVPRDTVAIGEIGLGGEIRRVAQTPRRLAEAARLGYRRALVPRDAPTVDGIHNIAVDTIGAAVSVVMPAALAVRSG